jgi:probable HAF family extracellular repeat protein
MRSSIVRAWLLFLLAAAVSPRATAQSYSFTPLGDLPGGTFYSVAGGISADGSTVVGYSDTADNLEGFRWTRAGGMVDLRNLPGFPMNGGLAYGASGDGSVIVGEGFTGTEFEAFRWSSTTGMVFLGGGPFSIGYGVSDDGSTVVGRGAGGFQFQATRWTSAGIEPLGDLLGGTGNSTANAASGDGSVVTGYSWSANGTEAFRWTQATGMTSLGDLSGGAVDSKAGGITPDGSVIVGSGTTAAGREAFRWTQATGLVSLGDMPGGITFSVATDTSADGSLIVGFDRAATGTINDKATVWTPGNGMQYLNDLLVSHGVGGLANWQRSEAYGVSDDGHTIVGYGINPAGNTEAWVATVPEPSSAMLAGCGLLLLLSVNAARDWRHRRGR